MTIPTLTIDLPFIPPSENKIRIIRVIRGKPGGLAYTREAALFKKSFKDWIRENYLVPIQYLLKKHTDYSVYDIHIDIFFPAKEIINKGWPKTKSFYKRMDIGNRRKLLEDCLSEVLGIDDSLFFKLTMIKRLAAGDRATLAIDITQHDDARLYGIKAPTQQN